MTGDRCTECGHAWHGLPCRNVVYCYENSPYQTGPCPCRGPFATTEETT